MSAITFSSIEKKMGMYYKGFFKIKYDADNKKTKIILKPEKGDDFSGIEYICFVNPHNYI